MTSAITDFDCTHLSVVKDTSGMDKLIVDNPLAYCEVYLHGAHITEFKAKTATQGLLWLSPKAVFARDKAIRGGIPICWPWFGAHPTDKNQPAHGFARVSLWRLTQAKALDCGGTELCLTLTDNAETRCIWPFRFTLEYTIKVTEQLEVSLVHINTDKQPVSIGGALHSYFKVGEIAQVQIAGLAGATYLDKLADGQACTQSGEIRVAAEVDSVYLDCANDCTLKDRALGRTISICKQGSDSTIVWNPWLRKSQQMADMSDDGYRHMVCIEAGVVNGKALAPGEQCELAQRIEVVSD